MSALPLKDRYNSIYSGLSEVREIFHREGRLSDSNQKLDETVKLLAIHFAAFKGAIPKAKYAACLSKQSFEVSLLQELFSLVKKHKVFRTSEGQSLFENSPDIAFNSEDKNLAYELFKTLSFVGVGTQTTGQDIDFLNEAFGHFVRDNFRSNIEDAQYMTPPEVVDFMVDLGKSLLDSSDTTDISSPRVVMDPSCGVGSFLSSYCRRDNGKGPKNRYVAQDKVERMCRLTAANFVFSDTNDYEIHIGNSLVDGSPLDQWNGRVDLILTNPPFGAKFSATEISKNASRNLPSYASADALGSTIDSELLFLDRYLSLLRDGGYCLVVVPDGVISAKGPAAFARKMLLKNAQVIGIIELPPVTFAQAGTRTKTSILIFRKGAQTGKDEGKVFVAEAESLGFEVSKRKGATQKKAIGVNQLTLIEALWKSKDRKKGDRNQIGSWVQVQLKDLECWTPRSILFSDKSKMQRRPRGLVKLRELVKPLQSVKAKSFQEGSLFISVLHVTGEGLLDINALLDYKPITPGKPIKAGCILVSRLNPRIPRVLVVPPLPGQIICSSEFEVLEPAAGVDPYALSYVLMTQIVQEQLRSMTAGTSASHSRIRPGKMLEVSVPWSLDDSFVKEMQSHKRDLEAVFQSMWSIIGRHRRLDA